LESFREVGARLGSGRALISTVDAWCPEGEVAAFLRTAQGFAPDTTVLAVTSLVADESPLWVTMDGSGRVTDLGGHQGHAVTAGMYVVPERVRRLAMPDGLGRLRDYLTWLVRQREPMCAVHLGDIVDVDRAEDVALAERMARRMNQAPVGS